MDYGILAFAAPGGLELIIIAGLFLVGCVLPVALVIWLIVCFSKTKAENQRLRIEIDQLTGELEALRSQANG